MTLDDETADRIAREAMAGMTDERDQIVAIAQAGYAHRDAEVEELRSWKAQAIEVLNGWERVWEATGMPGELGEQKSENVRRWAEELRDELEETRDHAKAAVHRADEAEATLAKVQELAGSGVGCDMNPTMMFTTPHEMYVQWAEYARRIDSAWRERLADLSILDESPTERLRDERDEALATLAKVREAWWSAAEQGDTGIVYTERVEQAMDDIWTAIADESPTERETPADTVTIPRPVVPFGPHGMSEDEGTAHYLGEVVRKIDTGFLSVGGSNVTATVRKLLLDAAAALGGGSR